ncbi:oligosaccharide flippase family protein [Mesorhizobium sp. CAU 1732]|uniref:oligosaccharide flippase family protein n=1 Tax=Mesorhizobium sp. CAU 1732 TaxID=3140358 RepID=UPI0032610CE2
MSRVRRAFMMASVEQYLALLVNFGMVAALARILSPAEIGTAVVGLGICVIVFSFREFATAEFLIQRPTVEAIDIRTSATILLGVTLILAILVFLGAPLLAGFYGQAGLIPFIWVLIAASIVEALAFPAVALLRRDMRFGALARLRTASLCASATVTIGLAAFGHGFMSYAWGSLASSCVMLAVAAVATPDAFGFKPSLKSWRFVYEFGRYRGAVGLVDRVYDAIPQLVLGRVMPMSDVGLYNRTSAVCAIPDRMLLGAIFAIAFPVLAERAREGRDIGDTYLRALGLITVIYWPALLMMALLADSVVRVLLGQAWMEIVPLVRIVAVASLFFFPVILTHPILMATGHNKAAFLSNLFSRAFAAIVLCLASLGGIKAMALGQFVAIPVEMLIALYFVRKAVPFEWRAFGGMLMQSGTVTLGTMAGPLAVAALSGWHFEFTPLEALSIVALAGMGWLAGIHLTRHPVCHELVRLPVLGPLVAKVGDRLRFSAAPRTEPAE